MTRPSIDQHVTFLYTRDLETTARFYAETLGLPLALDQGTCRIYRVSSAGYLGVCQRDGDPPTDGLIITLVSADVDGWYAYLQAQGVAFEQPPQLNPKYDIYHCFLRDPNGYLIEIQRFNQPFG
ncbi:MAG: VOC family protein [Chloroflexi bacterium]|nr:VOC family protein [Chloroflexota bacterium]